MNHLSEEKFNIIISVGDEQGIGPEIILKALASNEIHQNNKIIIIGSKKKLITEYTLLKSLGIKKIADPNDLDIKDIEIANISINNDKKNSGNASFSYLKYATELVRSLPKAALVTGPICKKSWALAGHFYSGQTEFLAESCNAKEIGMLFTAKSPITGWRFNTLLASTHIPLKEIPQYCA